MGRLGLRYDPRTDAADADPAAVYQQILEHAARAEAAGADVLWVAERPFVPGALLPAAFPVCAAIAQRTERVRIATGAVPLPLHHPVRVAEDAATLDVLSGGRLELGVGLGEHAEGFDGFGIPPGERAARLEEGVALLRAAWSDGPVSFEGRHYRVEDVEVHPKPVQRPHPPLWVAAQAEAAVERAARLGAGLLTDSLDAARRFRDAAPAPARIAWQITPGPGGAAAALPAFEAGLASLAGAEVDLVVPAHPERGDEGSEEAIAALAEGLRSAFARQPGP